MPRQDEDPATGATLFLAFVVAILISLAAIGFSSGAVVVWAGM